MLFYCLFIFILTVELHCHPYRLALTSRQTRSKRTLTRRGALKQTPSLCDSILVLLACGRDVGAEDIAAQTHNHMGENKAEDEHDR